MGFKQAAGRQAGGAVAKGTAGARGTGDMDVVCWQRKKALGVPSFDGVVP